MLYKVEATVCNFHKKWRGRMLYAHAGYVEQHTFVTIPCTKCYGKKEIIVPLENPVISLSSLEKLKTIIGETE